VYDMQQKDLVSILIFVLATKSSKLD